MVESDTTLKFKVVSFVVSQFINVYKCKVQICLNLDYENSVNKYDIQIDYTM